MRRSPSGGFSLRSELQLRSTLRIARLGRRLLVEKTPVRPLRRRKRFDGLCPACRLEPTAVSKNGKRGTYCGGCNSKRVCDVYHQDPEPKIESARISALRNRYGLSADDYTAMLASQGGVCFICKTPPTIRRLSVDHSHKTHQVRALLCNACNTRLGVFQLLKDSGLDKTFEHYLAQYGE